MNKKQFYNIISDSNLLANADEQSIDEIIAEFPYFQTAYILKSKILSDKGSFKYDNFIKLASLYSADRTVLYNYLHTENSEIVIGDSKIDNSVVEENTEDKLPIENTYDDKKEIIVVEKPKEPRIVQEAKLEVVEDKFYENKKSEENFELKEKVVSQENTLSKVENIVDEITDVSNVELIIEENKLNDSEPNKTVIHEGATLAEKIIHKYKDLPKSDNKESIADVILRKAAEAKNINKSGKAEIVLSNKVNEIVVEQKHFEPVKLETKTLIEKPKVITEDAIINDSINDDAISEIESIAEGELVSDYFVSDDKDAELEPKDEMSFDDWLNFVQTPVVKENKTNNQLSLIDKFISSKSELKIKAKGDTSVSESVDISKGEVERDGFITETLANIYIQQKIYDKAISAFTKLSLKYPEKNSYFADRIKKIEKLIKK